MFVTGELAASSKVSHTNAGEAMSTIEEAAQHASLPATPAEKMSKAERNEKPPRGTQKVCEAAVADERVTETSKQ